MKSAKRTTAEQRKPAPSGAPATRDLPTATALKLWVVLARAYAAVAAVSRDSSSRHDLTPAEFGILEALYHKGPLLLGEVQKKILVSSGGITFLVDRLAERGLVERRACQTDRRARYAALTRRGEKVMREIFPEHAARIREALVGLGQADQRQVTALLKALGKEAQRIAADTPECRQAAAETDP